MAFTQNNNNWYSSIANATANNEYATFSLTVGSNQLTSLNQLDFGVGLQNQGATPDVFTALTYSTDGITFNPVTAISNMTESPGNSNSPGTNFNPIIGRYDLSAIPALQNLTTGETITFQLFDLTTGSHGYEVGDYNIAGNGPTTPNPSGLDVEIDGVSVSAVPEPSTYIMFGCSLMGLMAVQRLLRQKNSAYLN